MCWDSQLTTLGWWRITRRSSTQKIARLLNQDSYYKIYNICFESMGFDICVRLWIRSRIKIPHQLLGMTMVHYNGTGFCVHQHQLVGWLAETHVVLQVSQVRHCLLFFSWLFIRFLRELTDGSRGGGNWKTCREPEPYKTIGRIEDPLLGQSILLRIPGNVHVFFQWYVCVDVCSYRFAIFVKCLPWCNLTSSYIWFSLKIPQKCHIWK